MPHRHPSLIAAPPPAPGRLWLTGARLWDGTGGPVRENAAVLVTDGVIERVGSGAEAAPEGARTLDLGGRMLIPGLINLHIHVQGHEPAPDKGGEPLLPGTSAHFLQAGLRDTLRFGVTTLRNVGSQDHQPQEARQAMRYGAFRGPRLLTCGLIISSTAPGGRFYGAMYREADGPDEMRKAVREQLREGADFIKVMTTGARSNELEDPDPTQLTDDEFAALVSEAHRMGVRVAAHVEGLDGTAAAIDHGMDTIEHGMYLNQRPELLERMAAGGQVLVPTLGGYYWMAGINEAIDPASATPDPQMLPRLVELANYNLQEGTQSMRAALAGGGTDRARVRPRRGVGRGHGARTRADDPPWDAGGGCAAGGDVGRGGSDRIGRSDRHRGTGPAGRPPRRRRRRAGRAVGLARPVPDLGGVAAGRARRRAAGAGERSADRQPLNAEVEASGPGLRIAGEVPLEAAVV